MKRILTTHVGEHAKGGDWLSYVEARFGGFEPRPAPPDERPSSKIAEGARQGGTALAPPPVRAPAKGAIVIPATFTKGD